MARHHTLAQFEFFVLLSIERLGERARGGDIRRSIEERGGRSTALGAVYAALNRLEEKGLVTHRVGPPSPVRGGRGRKHFRLTARGERELRRTEDVVRRMMSPDSVTEGAG